MSVKLLVDSKSEEIETKEAISGYGSPSVKLSIAIVENIDEIDAEKAKAIILEDKLNGKNFVVVIQTGLNTLFGKIKIYTLEGLELYRILDFTDCENDDDARQFLWDTLRAILIQCGVFTF